MARRRRKPKIPLRNPQPVEEIVPTYEGAEINSAHPAWYTEKRIVEMEERLKEDKFEFDKMTNEELGELARKIGG
jgi:hypothetical protein